MAKRESLQNAGWPGKPREAAGSRRWDTHARHRCEAPRGRAFATWPPGRAKRRVRFAGKIKTLLPAAGKCRALTSGCRVSVTSGRKAGLFTELLRCMPAELDRGWLCSGMLPSRRRVRIDTADQLGSCVRARPPFSNAAGTGWLNFLLGKIKALPLDPEWSRRRRTLPGVKAGRARPRTPSSSGGRALSRLQERDRAAGRGLASRPLAG